MTRPPSKASRATLEEAMGAVFAPWVRELELKLVDAFDGEVHLELPVAPRHVHAGGVLCGQTMMAAADSAMVLAVAASLGEFRPMTTVQLQTSFLRPVAGDAGTVRVVARVLRRGRQIVFGEIELFDPAARLVAHATTTYTLL